MALLEHEDECTFDPPCVCPLCNEYTFFWPKTDEERQKIIEEHGHHLVFQDAYQIPLYLDSLYDSRKKEYKSLSQCYIFQPAFECYDSCAELKDVTALRKVDLLSSVYPYMAIWIEHHVPEGWESGIFNVRAQWLQRASRIVPDSTYFVRGQIINFHSTSHSSVEYTVNPLNTKLNQRGNAVFGTHMPGKLMQNYHRPCGLCKDLRKHFHFNYRICRKKLRDI